jgi:hypothetical protein
VKDYILPIIAIMIFLYASLGSSNIYELSELGDREKKQQQFAVR